MSMNVSPIGQNWPAQPIHNDLKQKLVQELSDYRQEISQLSGSEDEASRSQLEEDYRELSQAESKLAQISAQSVAPAAYQKTQAPPPTDEEMNRRFGNAYSVEIFSLQSSRTMTSATPELESASHL